MGLLNKDERVRLESLNQAVSSAAMTGLSARAILNRAKVFEAYIKTGKAEAIDIDKGSEVQ